MQRINVVGVSGSGKSTFAKQLAYTLNFPYIEMDALYWRPHWQEASTQEFLQQITSALKRDRWVLDGNYHSKTVAHKWQRADTVIWLNYGFCRTLWQVCWRCVQRAWTKQELWPGTGNKESFYRSFFTRDSVIWWMLTNYHHNQTRYEQAIHSPQFTHLHFYRLTNPKQSQEFLLSLSRQQSSIANDQFQCP